VLHTTATRWQQEPEYLTPYYPRVDVLYGDLRKTCSSPVHHDGSCETEVNGVVSGQRQWAASVGSVSGQRQGAGAGRPRPWSGRKANGRSSSAHYGWGVWMKEQLSLAGAHAAGPLPHRREKMVPGEELQEVRG